MDLEIAAWGGGRPAVGPGVVGRARIADLPGPHMLAPQDFTATWAPQGVWPIPSHGVLPLAQFAGNLDPGGHQEPKAASWRQGIPVPTLHAMKLTGQLLVNLAPNLCFS